MTERPVVAVACSGGRDSVALLHAALAAGRTLGVGIVALHVHHGLMADADRWAADLAALCDRLQLPFRWERLAGSPARGESVEAWARRERYAALARMARAAGAGVVLLGHHLHDQAETVLLQALRGGGPAALAAMPAVREQDGVAWIRPWLERRGAEIEAYVATLGVPVAHDPSNADPRFARSRLRHAVMPALREAFPGADAALAAVARRAAEARAVLDEVAAQDLDAIGAGACLPLAAWRGLSPARQANALRAWLADRLQAPVPQALVERLLAEAGTDTTRRWPAARGRGLRAWRGELALVAVARGLARVVPAPAPARRGAGTILEEGEGSTGSGPGDGEADGVAAPVIAPLSLLRCARYALDRPPGAFEVFATDHGGIAPHRLAQVEARARLGGERFCLRPGGLPRSLKKQFQAAAVAAEDRAGPLLFDAAGRLLFVPGLGIDAREWAAPGAPQWGLRWWPA